jgi:hypothetical protein
MPSKTPRQHRAMEAAANGRGRLGIPPKVASEFVAADAGKPSIGKALGSASKKPMPPKVPKRRGAK